MWRKNHIMELLTVGHVISQNGAGKSNSNCTRTVNNHGSKRGLVSQLVKLINTSI